MHSTPIRKCNSLRFNVILTTDNDPIPEQVAQLSQEVHNNDLLQLLVFNMQRFEFEVNTDHSRTTSGCFADGLILHAYLPGAEGCVSNFQQSFEETNWFSMAYSRISLPSRRSSVYAT